MIKIVNSDSQATLKVTEIITKITTLAPTAEMTTDPNTSEIQIETTT